jgi:hypothetical protein
MTRQRWATAESEAFADTGRVLPKGAAFSVPGRACVNEGIVFGAIWDARHTIPDGRNPSRNGRHVR